ncbi:MAG: Xaa-Pro peptidase family protein [Pseudomonadota bacterium]
MTVFHDSPIDHVELRRVRLKKLRNEMSKHDIAGLLLYDPLHIRYATDTSNMQIWTMHNAVRYVFIANDGPVILFDYHNCRHLSEDIEILDDIRPAISWFAFSSGERAEEMAQKWADEIADLVRLYGHKNTRLGVDKLDPLGLKALEKNGIKVIDSELLIEQARSIKADIEIDAMIESIEACEEGMRRMHQAMRPGISENKLWSILHQANIELGGEWIETRLLCSGNRTFPWFRECSSRILQQGDLVAFDTDLIGPHGYCADISRTWLCGDKKPTDIQRQIYQIAYTQIEKNIEALKPGMSFFEYSEKCFQLPDDCLPYRYSVLAHGVGLCDEYPSIAYKENRESAYDGTFQPNMVICVESLVGSKEAGQSVKLEEQVLITQTGTKRLSTYPYENIFLEH